MAPASTTNAPGTEATVSCRCLTASCHTEKQGSRRVRYFQALEISQSLQEVRLTQSVALGHLVVYAVGPESFAPASVLPKCQVPSRIGQVVALLETKDWKTHAAEFQAVVRPFLPFDQVQHHSKHNNNNKVPQLSADDDRKIRNNLRVSHLLFETTDLTETIPCRDILLGRMVHMVPPAVANTAQAFRDERITLTTDGTVPGRTVASVDAWRLKYICAHRIQSDGSLVPVPEDWWKQQHHTALAMPRTLERGLACLQNEALVAASREHFDTCIRPYLQRDVTCWIESVHATATTQGGREERAPELEQQRPQEEQETAPASSFVPVKRSERTQTVTHKRSRSANKMLHIEATGAVVEPQQCPEGRDRTRKRARSSTCATNHSETGRAARVDEDQSSAATNLGSIVAVSESVYSLTGRARGQANKPTIHFHTHVDLAIDPSDIDPKIRSQLASQWTVSVGDVVAVYCDEAADFELAGKPLYQSNLWFPFKRPWSAAQVLSIYTVGGVKEKPSGQIENPMYFMELKWFYRPNELDSETVNNLPEALKRELFGKTNRAFRTIIEVDEHVSEARVHSALGRVLTASTGSCESKEWKRFLSVEGVPQIWLRVPYAYSLQLDDKILHKTSIWDGLGKTYRGPFETALTCEKGWPGRQESKKLRKVYKAFLTNKYQWIEEDKHKENVASRCPSMRAAKDESADTKRFAYWPKDLLSISDTDSIWSADRSETLGVVDLGHGKNREFLYSLQLAVVRKRCHPDFDGNRLAVGQFWGLHVGDFVCVINDKTSRGPEYCGPSSWYPFLGPWSVCQVLCIYRDSSRRGKASIPLLELRQFAFPHELPPNLYSWMPTSEDTKRLYCFETSLVEVDVPVSRVLGRADLYLGPHNHAARGRVPMHDVVPTVACRCNYFYDHVLERFQPLFSVSRTPNGWRTMMTKRGLETSTVLRMLPGLNAKVAERITVESRVTDIEPLLSDEAVPIPQAMELDLEAAVPHFFSVPVHPLWTAYTDADRLCPAHERDGLFWSVRIGDYVAVQYGTVPESRPFTVPWKVARVLSLFLGGDGLAMAEVRWFERCAHRNEFALDEIDAKNPPQLADVPVKDFLCPIFVFGGKIARSEWRHVYPFLPAVPFSYPGNTHKQAREEEPGQFFKLLCDDIALSSHYRENDFELVRRHLIEREKASFDDTMTNDPVTDPLRSSSENIRNIESSDSMSTLPALSIQSSVSAHHEDLSSNVQFFKSAQLRVSEEFISYQNTSTHDSWWTVRPGDMVILQYNAGGRRVKMADCKPFSVPWAVAEIVTIFKRSNSSDFQLEIRWFYRLDELPGSERRNTESSALMLDEIFESDHYDEVSASCLIAPVKLADPTTYSPTDEQTKWPFVFLCRSFWSQKNNSIVPSGGLSGRVSRGKRFSKYFSQLHSIAEKANNVFSSSEAVPHIVQCFQRVVKKLSLTDASKEAIESGDGLVGRVKERETISDFLRAAVVGRIDDKRPSIFIAGPPGVGKTICVRAVIADLQREQSSGKLPPFNFIAMNGMEMRHPLEFNVRLLEHLTGERLNLAAKTASQRLDSYFSKPNGEPSTTVLLVDEIDYLVTRDQSVIYSLFDWPARAAESGCPRKLILIGISNTLNLPEQMHPRVQSRLGSHRCPFRAYGIAEAAAILRSKITQASPDYEVFKQDCIDFAAKKTAALSGDIRKALTICRTAAESVLEEIENGKNQQEKPQVVLKHLFNVTSSSFNSPQVHRVAALADFEVLVVVALAWLSKSTGREQGGFDVEEIVTKMQAMSNALGESRYTPPLTLSETLEVLSRLGTSQLVSLQTPCNTSINYRASMAGSGGAWPLVALAVEANSIWLALKGSQHEALAQRYLKR